MFDVIVVGKGMIGSAAARHLSDAGAKVALIGPDEPANLATHNGVFASHYDQGRLAHRSARHPIWAHLAARSLAAYRTIESRSGVPFYTVRGTLTLERDSGSFSYTARREQIQHELGFAYDIYPSPQAVQQAFPMVACPNGFHGLFDPPPTGFINPRALIRAELVLAEANGTQIIREIATTAETHAGHVQVTTREGTQLDADALLVATGAFAGCFDLLPRPPAIFVKSEVVTLGAVKPTQAGELESMPAMLYDIESPMISEIYLVPPVPYPDGTFYLKLGSNAAVDQHLTTLAEIQHWMRQGDTGVVMAHQRMALKQLFPKVQFQRFVASRCIITRTPTGLPFIDQISERTYVALGGNGAAAKSADTIGELAAQLVLGQAWDAPFEREALQFKAAL